MFSTKKASKKATYIALMLLSFNCHAGGVEVGLPKFKGGDAKENEALNKAAEAAMIQTGGDVIVKKMVGEVISKGKTVADTVINDYTPFTQKQVYFVAGTAYTVLVKKQMTKSYNNPIIPGVRDAITIGNKSIKYTWTVSF